MSELPVTRTMRLETDGAVLYAAFNQPEQRNPLTREAVDDLFLVCDAVVTGGMRALVLSGEGGVFCAGGDLKAFTESGADPLANNRRFGELLFRLDSLPAVVIAAIDGPAFGGAIGLVCVADVVVATPGSVFAVSETTLGLVPAQIAPYLVRRVGSSRARLLALTGCRCDGARACQWGLVDQLSEDRATLFSAVKAIASDVQRCAPRANASTKELLARAPQTTSIEQAARLFADSLRGEEANEGLAAYLGKRKPSWRPS